MGKGLGIFSGRKFLGEISKPPTSKEFFVLPVLNSISFLVILNKIAFCNDNFILLEIKLTFYLVIKLLAVCSNDIYNHHNTT